MVVGSFFAYVAQREKGIPMAALPYNQSINPSVQTSILQCLEPGLGVFPG